MSDGAFSSKLRRYGIDACAARTAALIALATDLPAPVLADLLDLHITTAVRWVTYVKRDWTDYLAVRAADQAAAASGSKGHAPRPGSGNTAHSESGCP